MTAIALFFIEDTDFNIYEKAKLLTVKGALPMREIRFSERQTYFFELLAQSNRRFVYPFLEYNFNG